MSKPSLDRITILAKDVDYIQDPATGRFQGSHGHGGGEGGTSSGGAGKKKADMADFAKDQVNIDTDTRSDQDKQKKFVDTWNDRVGEAPAEFKNKFLGGLKATMGITYADKQNFITVSGKIQNESGDREIGEYTRTIYFDSNKASSDYFRIDRGEQGKNVGKQVLAANVRMYGKLGIDTVEVHADIDVGGYAWAKYGYVPTQHTWYELTDEINTRIDRLSSGGENAEAGSWEELDERSQNRIEQAFRRQTFDEFRDSDIQNWRDSGQPLDDAKEKTAEDFNGPQDWGEHAIAGYRKERDEQGKSNIPFTDEQLMNAITVDYNSDREGRGDFSVEFHDELLKNPQGYQSAQPTLPGISEVQPHEYLTEDMRDGITTALEKAFDREAESKESDIEAPSWIDEQVAESQGEYWGQLDDSEKYKWAESNTPDMISGGGVRGTGEMSDDDANRLRTLTGSDDPKAIWAIADSEWGKQLLLDSDWNGVLNLKDKETMDRFNAYVGKA